MAKRGFWSRLFGRKRTSADGADKPRRRRRARGDRASDIPGDASLPDSEASDEPWYRQGGPLFTESFADPQPGIAPSPPEPDEPPQISFDSQAGEIPRIESASAAPAEWDVSVPESVGQIPLADSEDPSVPAPDDGALAVAATDDDAAWLPPSSDVDPPADADEPSMGSDADVPSMGSDADVPSMGSDADVPDEEVVADAGGQDAAAEPEGAATDQAPAVSMATDLEAAPAAQAVAAGSRTASSEPPSIVPIRGYYLTRAHDTLRSVAAQFLNAPERWAELRSINAAQPGVAAAGADTLLTEGTAVALPGEPLVWGRPDPVYLWTLAETFLYTAWGREPTPEEVVPFWRGLAAGAAPDEAGPPQIGTDLPGIEARADLPSEFDLPPSEESESSADEPSEGHDSAVMDGEVVDSEPRTAVDALDDDIADAEVVSVESRSAAEAEDADDGDVVGAEEAGADDGDVVAVLDEEIGGAVEAEDADDGDVEAAVDDVVGAEEAAADVGDVVAVLDEEIGGVVEAEDADVGDVEAAVDEEIGGVVEAAVDDVVGAEAGSIDAEFDAIVDERDTGVVDAGAADAPWAVDDEAEDDQPRESGVFAVRAVPEDVPAADAESEAVPDAVDASVGDAVEELVDDAAPDAVEVFVEDAAEDVSYAEAIEAAAGELADADTDWAVIEDESIAIAELDAAATPGDAHDDAVEPAQERDDGEIPSPQSPPMPSQADVLAPLSTDAPPLSPPDVPSQEAAALPLAPEAPLPPEASPRDAVPPQTAPLPPPPLAPEVPPRDAVAPQTAPPPLTPEAPPLPPPPPLAPEVHFRETLSRRCPRPRPRRRRLHLRRLRRCRHSALQRASKPRRAMRIGTPVPKRRRLINLRRRKAPWDTRRHRPHLRRTRSLHRRCPISCHR